MVRPQERAKSASKASAACLLSLAMAASPFGSVALADDGSSVKEETVYVKAGSSGKVEGVYVVNMFDNGVSATVEDPAAYESVKNLSTYDDLAQSKGAVQVKTDAERPVYYQGSLNSSTQLPWNIDVSFKLDGRDVSVDEVAGASGKLAITLDVKALDGESDTSDFSASYVLQAQGTFDEDNFRLTDAGDATCARAGNNTIVACMVLPGDNHTFVLEGDARNFSYDGWQVSAMPLSMAIDLAEQDTSALSEKTGELKDSTEQLADGASGVVDGTGEIADGAASLAGGASSVADGAAGIADGANGLKSGADRLSAGAASAASGASQLSSQSSAVNGGWSQIEAGIGSLAQGASALEGGSAQFLAALKDASAASATQGDAFAQGVLDQLIAQYENGIVPGINSVNTGLSQLDASSSAFSAGLLKYTGGVDELSLGLGDVAAGAVSLQDGASLLQSGAGSLEDGANVLASGAGDLKTGAYALKDGAGRLSDGTNTLAASVADIDSQILDELQAVIDEKLGTNFKAHSFVVPSNTNVKQVQFAYVVEGIDGQGTEDPAENTLEESEDESFLNRFLALFGKDN